MHQLDHSHYYGGTTTIQDEKILMRLAKGDKDGANVLFPVLIGKEIKVSDQPTLSRHSLEEIFACLDPKKMIPSISYFPLDLSLNAKKRMIRRDTLRGHNVYDPRFLLVQFWHLLSPDQLINCSAFIEKHALSYIIVSLSSNQPCMRRLGYSCLQRFYRKLESSPHFQDKKFWINFIDQIRTSLKEDNEKIQRMETSFWHHAITIMNNPKSSTFTPVKDFVTSGKHLDVQEIVRFLSLTVKSKDIEKHSDFSKFVLRVVSDGMTSEEDFKLILKFGLIDWMMMFSSSSHSEARDKEGVLSVFQALSRHDKKSTMKMCLEKGLLSFLMQESLECEKNFIANVSQHLHEIVFNLLLIVDEDEVDQVFAGQVVHLSLFLMTSSEDNRDALKFSYETFESLVKKVSLKDQYKDQVILSKEEKEKFTQDMDEGSPD